MALTDGIVAAYNFDGDATDSSGNGNNGTVFGATFVSGFIGQAASFDGTNDYVSVPQHPSIQPQYFTVSFWVNFDTLTSGGFEGVMSNGDSSTDVSGFHIDTYEGGGTGNRIRAYAFEDDLSIKIIFSDNKITTSTWYHVVFRYDGTTLDMFIDGNLQTDTATVSEIRWLNDDLYIGARYLNNEILYFHDGLIDAVGIWNRALTSTEVSELYNNGDGLQYPFTTTGGLTVFGQTISKAFGVSVSKIYGV